MKILSLPLLLCLAALAVGAQPFGTDLFASDLYRVGGQLGGDVLRIDPNGKITTVLPRSLIGANFPNMVMMDNNNTELVVLETQVGGATNVLRIYDVILGVAVGSLQAPSGINLAWLDRTGTGDFYVVGSTSALVVKRDGSGTSTIRSGAPFLGLHTCVQDLATGGLVVGETNILYRLARDGTIQTTWTLPGLTPISMTQDHRDGTVVVGSASQVLGFHQDGSITTIHPSTQTNCNAIAFDRWSGNGEIVVGSDPIVRLTTGGVIVTTHPGIPSTPNTGMCFDQGRNLVCILTASPNRYRYDIHIPGQPGRPFALGLSLSGFRPGIPIGGRTIQLVPDSALILSITGALFPLLKQNLGRLSAFGRASAVLDLSQFGPVLQGTPVWSAAVTFDPAAPMGVGVITKPTVTILE